MPKRGMERKLPTDSRVLGSPAQRSRPVPAG